MLEEQLTFARKDGFLKGVTEAEMKWVRRKIADLKEERKLTMKERFQPRPRSPGVYGPASSPSLRQGDVHMVNDNLLSSPTAEKTVRFQENIDHVTEAVSSNSNLSNNNKIPSTTQESCQIVIESSSTASDND